MTQRASIHRDANIVLRKLMRIKTTWERVAYRRAAHYRSETFSTRGSVCSRGIRVNCEMARDKELYLGQPRIPCREIRRCTWLGLGQLKVPVPAVFLNPINPSRQQLRLGMTLTMNSIRRNIQIPGMGSRLRLVHSQQLRDLPHTLRKSRIPRRSRSSLARERDRRIHICRDMGTLFLKLFEKGSCLSPRMSRRPSKPSIVSRKFIH